MKNNLKLSAQISIFFSALIIVVAGVLSGINYYSSKQNMKQLQNDLVVSNLKHGMNVSKSYFAEEYGSALLVNGTLSTKEGNSIAGKTDLVDKIKNDLGLVATVFVKKGEDFERISTNIVDKSGQRVTGTMLGTKSAAYANMIAGKDYLGGVEILGAPYSAYYYPIKSEDGNVIGILFIGISQSETNQQIDSFLAENLRNVALITLGVLVVSVLFTRLLARTITSPIKVIIKHINDIAEYDLQNNISEEYTLRKDEVGDLARIVQKIEDNLRSLIKAIGITSEHVAASSEELTATSQQAATASNEVAKAIDEIAKGATDQAQSTSDGAHQLTQLGNLIEEEKEKINVLTGSSDKVNILVKEGLEVIESLSRKTHETVKASMSVYQSIIKTDESSKHISEASGLISSIAQQTNLLALNASIEAARAGEQGRGFSVVADEIKKLAEQSALSIKTIDEMVHSLQMDSKEAVEVMQKVRQILDEQNMNVDHTEGKYKEISEAIKISSEAVFAIEKTSELMENKKNEVLDTMHSLSAVAQENAAGTEEASASIEEQTLSMDDIAKSSEDLSMLAQELNVLITKFKMK